MPWGVTANLLIRRSSVRFSSLYPKTGGGEDIAFCLDTLASGVTTGAIVAAPALCASHPWWDDGRFTSLRFWRWACGDGILQVCAVVLCWDSGPAENAEILEPPGC